MTIDTTKAKIFLGSERGLTETDWFRTYNLFNTGSYINPHKEAFHDLYMLNEETLAAERALTTELQEDTFLLVLPVVGSIQCSGMAHDSQNVQAGELLVWPAAAGSSLRTYNPYADDSLVQFLQVGIKVKNKMLQRPAQRFTLNIDQYVNRLSCIGQAEEDDLPFVIGIGKYSGRREDEYQLAADRSLFVYVIQGAFEVQSRLLHAGDGLALWDTSLVEWEALSNDAVLLIIDQPAGSY